MSKYFLGFYLLFFANLDSIDHKYVIGCHKGGFFANFMMTIGGMGLAEQNGLTPTIFWGKESSYYEKIKGENVWEYYFEPVSELSYDKTDEVHCFPYNLKSKTQNLSLDEYYTGSYWQYGSAVRNEYNSIIKKRIGLKPNIENIILEFFNKNMLEHINIGIHLRGTDLQERGPEGDLKRVRIDTILSVANDLATNLSSQGNNVQFFVASDDQRLLDEAIKKLNNKLIYYNSQRSKDGVPLYVTNWGNKAPAHIPPYSVGEDVIIDAFLLSKCDYLFHVSSSVATSVAAINPNLKLITFKSDTCWVIPKDIEDLFK